MIKLIASDMDGTLLKEGTVKVNPEVLEVILKLKEKGVIFAAASGRQYKSMLEVFEPIKNDIIFIAENGGYVTCRGREIERYCFDRQLLEDSVKYIRDQDGFVLVAAPDMSYTDSRDQELIHMIREGYKVKIAQVEDVLKLDVPVVKVAMYCKNDAFKVSMPAAEHFRGRLNVMASGAYWVDFVRSDVDKGNALMKIQKMMNIKKEETMAFGDNDNDIGMLNCAGESYAVANARENVKAAARHIAGSNVDDGVLKVLKTLL